MYQQYENMNLEVWLIMVHEKQISALRARIKKYPGVVWRPLMLLGLNIVSGYNGSLLLQVLSTSALINWHGVGK